MDGPLLRADSRGQRRALGCHAERLLETPRCEDHASQSVTVTVDERDLERTRLALQTLARRTDERNVLLAATRVEIALEDDLARARESTRPIDVELDATVIALASLALFERATEGAVTDPFRQQAREFLRELRETDPALSDAVATTV